MKLPAYLLLSVPGTLHSRQSSPSSPLFVRFLVQLHCPSACHHCTSLPYFADERRISKLAITERGDLSSPYFTFSQCILFSLSFPPLKDQPSPSMLRLQWSSGRRSLSGRLSATQGSDPHPPRRDRPSPLLRRSLPRFELMPATQLPTSRCCGRSSSRRF